MKNECYDLEFEHKVKHSIEEISSDIDLYSKGLEFIKASWAKGYAYNFKWLGVPVIKLPSDLMVLQEIIFKERPTLIIETGIARGGSLIFFGSLLKLINNGKAIGVDIDIRKHAHDVYLNFKEHINIEMIEGSSTSLDVLEVIKSKIKPDDKVMIILDSDHRYEHVKMELSLYSSLVTKGQYLCVTDTFIEDLPPGYFAGLGEGLDDVGDSPVTALKNWDYHAAGFILDKEISRKAVISENRDGYFKKIDI